MADGCPWLVFGHPQIWDADGFLYSDALYITTSLGPTRDTHRNMHAQDARVAFSKADKTKLEIESRIGC